MNYTLVTRCVIRLGRDYSLKTPIGGRDYATEAVKLFVDIEFAKALRLPAALVILFPVKDERVD